MRNSASEALYIHILNGANFNIQCSIFNMQCASEPLVLFRAIQTMLELSQENIKIKHI